MNEPLIFSRGYKGFCVILRALMDEPQTVTELSQKIGVGTEPLRKIIRHFHFFKMIHVQSWVSKGHVGLMQAAVWSGRPGIDAPKPMTPSGRFATNAKYDRPTIATTALAFIHFWQAMDGDMLTIDELRDVSGICRGTLHQILPFMLELKLIYVAGWEKQMRGGDPLRMYMQGDRLNVSRPKPESRVVNSRKYQQKLRTRERQQRLIQRQCAPMSMFNQGNP